jgi:hypothetical protein
VGWGWNPHQQPYFNHHMDNPNMHGSLPPPPQPPAGYYPPTHDLHQLPSQDEVDGDIEAFFNDMPDGWGGENQNLHNNISHHPHPGIWCLFSLRRIPFVSLDAGAPF